LCQTLHIDSMTMKVADGVNIWHTPTEVASYRAIALDAGVGFVPFVYCYGPRFGEQQIIDEATQLLHFMEANDNAGAVADLEREYNNQPAAAAHFAACLAKKPGPLVISTWADPQQQAWASVLEALHPVADLIGPQQYTNYLAGCEGQFPGWCVLAPEINLSETFGPNNQRAIAQQARKRGHHSIWLWYEGYVPGNQSLVADLVDIMAAAPVPAPPGAREYTVQPGDSLWSIAAKPDVYGDGQQWPRIYAANQAEIGPDPDLIQPGQILLIP